MDKKGIKRLVFVLVSILVAIIIGNLEPPSAKLGPASMRFMGIFVGMLILLITQVIEDWVVMLLTLSFIAVWNVATIPDTFSAFAQNTIWLLIGVMSMAVGIANSGLLRRISAKILTLAPASYNGLIGAIMASGLAVTPLIASTTAKATLMAPLATSITEQVGLKERSRGALGLLAAAYMTTYIVGNAFLSGSANVGVMMGFMKLKEPISWAGWFAASSIWFLVLVVGTYLFCTTYCKPKNGEMEEINSNVFKERLNELGAMSTKEKIALTIALLALAAWITTSVHKFDAGMVALIATCALATFGLFTTQDFVTRVPWSLIIFIGALLGIASLISSLGVGTWLATILGPYLMPLISNPWIFIPTLCILSYVIRFVVISQFASLAIALAIFGPLVGQAGISVFVLVFVWYMCGNIWNMNYQNPVVLSILAAAGNKYVQFNDFRVVSYAYMLMCIVGFTASIPLWKALGFIM